MPLIFLLSASVKIMLAGAGAGAVLAPLATWLLLQASGLPALQALAGGVMVASLAVASFAWPCGRWRAALAGVPLAFAGK